jgi:hypothetical protein
MTPAGSGRLRFRDGKEARMLTQTQDSEEIIARVAALDIGKAELVCCVRSRMRTGRGGGCRRCRRTPR